MARVSALWLLFVVHVANIVADDDESSCPEDASPQSLQDLAADKKLTSIFVGGKGGVGKTTVAAALALKISQVRQAKVLLLSTDPAHSVGDAFNMTVGNKPVEVPGTRVSVVELDTKAALKLETKRLMELGKGSTVQGLEQQLESLKESMSSMPGADEATALSAVLEMLEKKDFEVLVYDTAPTGHTIRMLEMPKGLTKTLDNMAAMQVQAGQAVDLMNIPDDQKQGIKAFNKKVQKHLVGYKKRIQKVATKILAPSTTFVTVCIAEHLSVEETTNLITSLRKNKVHSSHIVTNQLIKVGGLTPADIAASSGLDKKVAKAASLAVARAGIQETYLSKIKDIDECIDVVEVPLLRHEVVGLDALTSFGDLLTPAKKEL